MKTNRRPIGAYDPSWHLSIVHVAPEESCRIHQDVGAKRSIGIHHSTFVLSEEPYWEPPRRLSQSAEKAGIKTGTLLAGTIGLTIEMNWNRFTPTLTDDISGKLTMVKDGSSAVWA